MKLSSLVCKSCDQLFDCQPNCPPHSHLRLEATEVARTTLDPSQPPPVYQLRYVCLRCQTRWVMRFSQLGIPQGFMLYPGGLQTDCPAAAEAALQDSQQAEAWHAGEEPATETIDISDTYDQIAVRL
ncbi:hypothetical protein WKR98_21495 [Pigmentiphaga sp. YJ18]|uniref:hypothetical protein n=1 Tax=Pigmentiphaga sp. YJ18 TaxID=3134907 RepID=UPI003111F8A5